MGSRLDAQWTRSSFSLTLYVTAYKVNNATALQPVIKYFFVYNKSSSGKLKGTLVHFIYFRKQDFLVISLLQIYVTGLVLTNLHKLTQFKEVEFSKHDSMVQIIGGPIGVMVLMSQSRGHSPLNQDIIKMSN